MEWSEELLTETRKKLNEIRKSPLDELRACFKVPEIANCLRTNIDLNELIMTLVSFWLGLCKIYLGSCPDMAFGRNAEADFALPAE
jgi:hypothetical protein